MMMKHCVADGGLCYFDEVGACMRDVWCWPVRLHLYQLFSSSVDRRPAPSAQKSDVRHCDGASPATPDQGTTPALNLLTAYMGAKQ